MRIDLTSRPARRAGRAGRAVWTHLPARLVSSRPLRACGHFIHRHYARHQLRQQTHFTRFLRNLPQLEVLSDRLARRPDRGPLRIASLGCSTGAELYSALWVIRSRHPDLSVEGTGVDISKGVLAAALKARYCRTSAAGLAGDFDPGVPELEGLSPRSREALFVADGDGFVVRDSIRRGTRWLEGDLRDPDLRRRLGIQDAVIVNNVLGPMPDGQAEACLVAVASLIGPGGYLVVEGVDLDVKVRVLAKLALRPVTDRLQEVYLADYWKRGWPWIRWAHEPIDEKRSDRDLRYATIFEKSFP